MQLRPDHRTTGSLRLEKTSRTIQSKSNPACHCPRPSSPPPGMGTPHVAAPLPHHSFGEEIFPTTQPNPPPAQLKAIPFHPSSLAQSCPLSSVLESAGREGFGGAHNCSSRRVWSDLPSFHPSHEGTSAVLADIRKERVQPDPINGPRTFPGPLESSAEQRC